MGDVFDGGSLGSPILCKSIVHLQFVEGFQISQEDLRNAIVNSSPSLSRQEQFVKEFHELSIRVRVGCLAACGAAFRRIAHPDVCAASFLSVPEIVRWYCEFVAQRMMRTAGACTSEVQRCRCRLRAIHQIFIGPVNLSRKRSTNS